MKSKRAAAMEEAEKAERERDWHHAARLWRAVWRITKGPEEEIMRVLSHVDMCYAESRAPKDPNHGCAGALCRTVGCSKRTEIVPPAYSHYPDYVHRS